MKSREGRCSRCPWASGSDTFLEQPGAQALLDQETRQDPHYFLAELCFPAVTTYHLAMQKETAISIHYSLKGEDGNILVVFCFPPSKMRSLHLLSAMDGFPSITNLVTPTSSQVLQM